MNDLIGKIQNELPGFSKGQKQIARFILEHYDKAAFMTASRLGTTVGVSESTVVRFATELGYEGYPHLQRALQEMIRNKLTSVQRMEVSSDRMGGRDVLQTVLHADMDMIRMTLDEIDRDAFQGAVDALLHARRVYILGVRSSGALASFMGFYFNLLFDNVHLVHTNSISEIFEQVLRIGEGDVFLGISFPRYSKRTLSAMRYSKDRGARVIALTDSHLSPLARVADHTLIAKSDMASFVDSLIAPLSVINALIVAVGMEHKKEIEATFNSLESIWEEYDVYEKPEDETT
ncbi:MurR/RpiR family transcriptional regulator [Butyricicoccus faecihominis]|uniref:MurR/RpiR family transcriptional regulator n=1 Tax=Butyricicoccaceae TaxID=3085642 RepID=UPI002478EFCA|nr:MULTISPECIES: MurR/RpiR family transcriptional regulator [Butyricicoccaceae]MCQ5128539.1 MurR/RpiR family transcriptional regulator [Butyricicoccus faecihominis]WNX83377.1 MurR/RpiR family transcriptional regulator [Agathobaculum sp. NTUH-O15-33]